MATAAWIAATIIMVTEATTTETFITS